MWSESSTGAAGRLNIIDAMQQAINETKEELQESETALVEYQNKLREMDWSNFDYLQERIGQITEDADFMIDLMSDDKLFEDNGRFTDEGMASVGLHGTNYDVYMAQADQYAKAIEEINRELANDPYNTKLIERKEALVQASRDAIQAAQDEKQAIIDLVQEGIDKELESLEELIDKYKESLDSAKD